MNNLTPFQFEGQPIRREWHEGEWWFSVIDVIEILTESSSPKKYWTAMKSREPQLSTICRQLKMLSKDGKKYTTDAVTQEGALRLIQSIPSKKAEPLKREIARLAKEKIEEVINPNLAVERALENYQKQGHSEEWIQLRLQSIGNRKQLTDEWKDRGVTKGFQYGCLTNTIHEKTFGMKANEHRTLKGLQKNQSLRDNTTPEELALIILGETTTRSLHRQRDSNEYKNLITDAKDGGGVAGNARAEMEKLLGESVVSKHVDVIPLESRKSNQNQDLST